MKEQEYQGHKYEQLLKGFDTVSTRDIHQKGNKGFIKFGVS